MTSAHPSAHAIPADPQLQGFLEDADRDVAWINAESPLVQIAAVANGPQPPFVYRGTLAGVEHYVGRSDGTFRKSKSPVPFEVRIEEDYCRSTNPLLQFQVLRTSESLTHPNMLDGVCCLGKDFRAATPLRAIVDRFYRLVSGQLASTDDPFDKVAAEFFLSHREEVMALEAPPLWRSPLARGVRVETTAPAAEVRS